MCSEVHDIDTKADETTSASREHNLYRADLQSLIVYLKKKKSILLRYNNFDDIYNTNIFQNACADL
jgi:hypothetical protein